MPVRALFLSFLLALVALFAVSPAAHAKPRHPKAKVVVRAKRKKHRAVAHRPTAVPTTAPTAIPAAAAVTCANTDLVADPGNLDLIRAALLCLHNQVRAENGLGALTDNGALDAAAAGHSADMVARGYFDHSTPEGGSFVERIIAASYAGADDSWTLGENLAWGTGELSTPAGLMKSWMASPGHRANILKPAYRELGVGLQLGTPTGESSGLTVSAEFGARGM